MLKSIVKRVVVIVVSTLLAGIVVRLVRNAADNWMEDGILSDDSE